MKISHTFICLKALWKQLNGAETLLFLVCIILLLAIAIPNFIKAKEQVEKNRIVKAEQKETIFKVGDSVKIMGIDGWGTINNGGTEFFDIIINNNNGTPIILKGINKKLLSK